MPIDFLKQEGSQIVSSGPMAQRLLASNMNVGALRTNATLRKDEWELLDKTVVEVARERLVAAADLFDRNLTLNIPNGMGTTIVQHEKISEMTAAEVSMDGRTRAPNDRVTFSLVSVPLPIIHHDFTINARALAASRNGGTPLDTTQVAEATRQVAETIEGMVLNGYTSNDILGFGSSSAQLFGYTNFTDRNTYTISTNWDDSAATGAIVLADVINMIASAHTARMFGPYMLYVPTAYWVPLMNDFKANSDKTILQRVKELPGIIDVKAADKLSANNVVLVQMTKSNIDMAVGLQPTTISWESEGGMTLFFKVMAIMVPRPKSDVGNRSGIVHAT